MPVGDHHVALVAVVDRVQAVVGADDNHAPVGVVLRGRARRVSASRGRPRAARAAVVLAARAQQQPARPSAHAKPAPPSQHAARLTLKAAYVQTGCSSVHHWAAGHMR